MVARHVRWPDLRGEGDLVFWKPYMKNPANPRKRLEVSGEGAEGRLFPTAKNKRAEENPKEPPEGEPALC